MNQTPPHTTEITAKCGSCHTGFKSQAGDWTQATFPNVEDGEFYIASCPNCGSDVLAEQNSYEGRITASYKNWKGE
jgi:ribosomal protein S27AE